MQIVAATRNRGKLTEIKRLFEGTPVMLLSLEDFPDCPEIEETGLSFKENALLKAKKVADFTGSPALADDSGLEVYELGGAPGVYSARYSGDRATDRKNNDKLLREMESIPDDKRAARFLCVIALAYPDGRHETFEGTVEGRIGLSQKGTGGFGYDPVFYPEGHSRTFAEMTPEEKDAMSHRARALRRLKEYLLQFHA